MKLCKELFVISCLLLFFGCSQEDCGCLTPPPIEPDIDVVSLQVTPPTAQLPIGLSSQFIALAIMSDDSVIDVTNSPSIAWTSSNNNIAVIDNSGATVALETGKTSITASIKNTKGHSIVGSATLTVTPAIVTALQVTPASNNVPQGLSIDFTATVFLSDGQALNVTENKEIIWSSSNEEIARVASNGIATGLKPGVVKITASGTANNQSFSGTANLTVTNSVVTRLQVTPAVSSIPIGLSGALHAQATLSDGRVIDVTTDPALTWSSSASQIANISNTEVNKGKFTGLSTGVVTMTASGTANGQSFTATAEVTVTPAVVIKLQVAPASSSVPAGLSEQLIAQATLSDSRVLDVTSDAALSWSSSNTQVATIVGNGTKQGLLTGVAPGTVTITASGVANGQTFKSSVQVIITDAVVSRLQIEPVVSSLPAGLSQQFHAKAIFSDGRVFDVTKDDSLSWTVDEPSIATILTSGANKGMLTGITPGNVTISAFIATNGQTLTSTAQVTITEAVIIQLQITPVTESVPLGLTKQFTAIATLSDGRTQDLTNDPALSWSSDSPNIATINSSQPNNNGLATGVRTGSTTITATAYVDGTLFNATAQLDVTKAVLTALQVTPSTEFVPVGLTKSFTAIATLSDGRTQDLTNDPALSWSSDSPNIATINSSQTNNNGLATGVSTGSTTITATAYVNGSLFNATVQLDVTQAVVTALQVTPITGLVPVGLTKPFTAIATLSDGRTQDLTNDPALSWSSDSPNIATINSNQPNNNGLATGVSTGSTTITATAYVDGTLFNATAQLDVTQAVVTALQVTPTTGLVPVGLTKPFTAIATLSDGRTQDLTNDPTLSWSSDSPNIATINSSQPNNNGLATGVSTGSTTITATAYVDGTLFNATAQLDVTQAVVTALQVTPTTGLVPVGLTKPFTAIATLSDGRTQDLTNDPALSWSSSPLSVATISSNQLSNNGIATGVTTGTATITAAAYVDGTLFNATAQLEVTQAVVTALQVTPATESVPAGLTKPFTAIATLSDGRTLDVTNDPTISWNSTPSSIATISSNQPEHNGIITGVAPGTAMITASVTANRTFFSATAQLTVTNAVVTALQVTPVTESVPVGLAKPFTAIATLSDGRTQDLTNDPALSWSSSPLSVATISSNQLSNNGIATGVTTGTATITAAAYVDGTLFNATAQLEVTQAVVTALQVTPVTESVPIGLTKAFTAIATLSDGRTLDVTNDPTISWNSTPSSVATISSNQPEHNGIITGVAPGTAMITASVTANRTFFSATAQLTVTNAVVTALQVTPVTESVPVGLAKPFTAIATLSDGRTQDLTNDPALSWSSSPLSVATISSNQLSNNGIATGVTTGTATITAAAYVDGTLFNATAQLEVTQAVVTALQVTPANESVPAGLTKPFTAIATLSDGRTLDVTNDPTISWNSTPSSIATISSNQPEHNGIITGVAPGTAMITASVTANRTFFSATAQLTVTNAVVTALQVTPVTESVPVGLAKPFTAIATLSDGRTQDLTNDPALSWSSSPLSVATISSNQLSNNGIATGVTTGTATITAAAYVDGTLFNATAQLEVTQAVVTALQVTPATESVPIGLTKAFTAIATLSDGSTQDVTNDPSLNWSSDALGIATISSNQPNNNGIVTGVNTGIATITASGTVNRVLISATAQLTVSNAIITALEVSPATEFVPVGLSKAFTAIATFSNGSRRDVTNDPALSWSSDAPGIATISSSQPDNNGLATGVSTGIATITASGTVNRAFFSATAQLTVIDAVVTDLEITPATESVPVGLTRRFIAIAIFSDGRMQDITDDPAISWSSTPSSVATISSNQPENNGIVTGVAPGTATITVSGTANRAFFSATAQLTVTNAVVTALAIEPTTELVPIGFTKPFSAIVTMSDGELIDVTNDPALSWSTAPSSVATISSNQPNSNGIATGVTIGTATITASGSTNGTFFSTTAQLTVTKAVLVAISITPNSLESLSLGRNTSETTRYIQTTKQLKATGQYSDGSNTDITNFVQWSTSNSDAMTVSATGVIKAGLSGNATISASLEGTSSDVATRAMPWIDVFKKPDTTRRNYAAADSLCTGQGLRLGSVNEMKALFVDATQSSTASPDSGYVVNNGMCATHGWPIGSFCSGSSNGYWTKLSGATYYSVHLNSGERVTSTSSSNYYAACMLN